MQIIPKYQSGGYIDMFTSYDSMYSNKRSYSDETNTKTSKKSSDSSDSSEKGQLTEKDFFSMLEKVNALPNERRAIISQLMDVFSESSLLERDTSDIKILYLQTLDQISQASINKNIYDEAVKSVQTNDAGGDVAISQSGKLVTLNNKGDLGYISLEEYYDDPESYTLISNSDLANFRRNSSSFINDQQAFDILQNAMSYKIFQQLVDQAKNSLGTMEYNREGLFASQNNKIVQGQKLLESLKENDQVQALGSVTANGLYEYDIIDKNQLQQIKAFTQYITTLLPERAKTWASLKSGNPDKNKAISDLVETYLISGQNITHDFNIDYKGSMEKVSKGSDNKSEEPDMTFLTALQFGYGTGREKRSLNLGGNSEIKVNGSAYGGILDQDQKSLYDINLNDMLMKSGISGITNMQSITFGDNIISSTLFPYIAVENNGGFLTILPCKRFGNHVVPNFDLAKKFEKITQDVIEEAGSNATQEQREALLAKKLSEDPETEFLLDMSGKIDWNHFASFFIVDGLASDRNINFITKSDNGSEVSISDANNPFIKVTTNQDKINYFKMVTQQDEYDENDSIWFGDWFGNYDTLYQGNIFIPIQTNNRLAAILFSGQTIKDSSAMAIQQEYMQTSKGMKNSSTNILGL